MSIRRVGDRRAVMTFDKGKGPKALKPVSGGMFELQLDGAACEIVVHAMSANHAIEVDCKWYRVKRVAYSVTTIGLVTFWLRPNVRYNYYNV